MATNIKLLDENALQAIKTYVDEQAAQAGKLDAIQINGVDLPITEKKSNIAADGAYNSSTNKLATQTTVTTAIGALDVSDITGFGANKTLATLTETDGIISATFQDIQIGESQVTNLTDDLASKVPLSRTIAGLGLSNDISSADLIAALGLTNNVIFVGVSTTDPKGSSGATVSGHTTWKKGEVVLYDNKEFILTGDENIAADWTELGAEGSYALKTITISAGSGLVGGGTLEANRTISHATPTGAVTTSSGLYKFSTDSFGHVNGTTAVTKSDLTDLGVADNTTVVHKSGDESIGDTKTFTGGLGIAPTTGSAWIFTAAQTGSDRTLSLALSDSYGDINLAFPTVSGTLALTSDIPSVSDFVKGPASSADGNIAVFNGTTGKLIRDGGTSLSTITGHLNNSTIHITSAERTEWNNKISSVKTLKTDAATSQTTSASEAIAGTGTITLHKISKTGKLTDLLSADGGSVSIITTAEINAILYPSA